MNRTNYRVIGRAAGLITLFFSLASIALADDGAVYGAAKKRADRADVISRQAELAKDKEIEKTEKSARAKLADPGTASEVSAAMPAPSLNPAVVIPGTSTTDVVTKPVYGAARKLKMRADNQ